MAKILRYVTVLAAFLFLSGCVLGPAPVDRLALSRPLYEPIVNGQDVTLELISVNGQEIPPKSLEEAIDTFSKYVAGEVRVVRGESVELDLGDDGAMTQEQFDSVVEESRHKGQDSIPVVVAPDFEFFGSRGAFSREWSSSGGFCQHIKLNARSINRSAAWLPFVPREMFWQMVMLHELGHAIGVPADRSHVSCGLHCSNPNCVMYSQADVRAVVTAILRLKPPLDFCRKCQAEIRKAHEAAGGKYYDASEYYNPSDEIIRLNPDNPWAYLLSASEYMRMDDYERVVADCARALEKEPKRFEAYFLRAVANRNLGNIREAIADFREAIEINPKHVSSLGMCAWLLSTTPEDDLRDGAYAVKLARRACKLTKWKDHSCLRSLAVAYAETGDFERAIEYETKAMTLFGADKASAAKFLEIYKAGKPYRDDRKESKPE